MHYLTTCLSIICVSCSLCIGQPQLNFKSGFEPDVYITSNYGDLRGSDGMDWQSDLEGFPEVGSFGFNYCGSAPSAAFAELRPDPVNASNTVLFMQVNDDDNTHSATARAQVEWNFETSGASLFRQGYIKYRVYWHEDIDTLRYYPSAISWFTIMEWWEDHNPDWDGDGAGQCRWSMSINKDAGAGQPFFWAITAEYMQPASKEFDDIWPEVKNRAVPVPIGQWVTLEVFFKKGQAGEGRIWVAMTPDGGQRQTVFDIHNYTEYPQTPRALRGWQFFKLYTSDAVLDWLRARGKRNREYYDDFEWWSDVPSTVSVAAKESRDAKTDDANKFQLTASPSHEYFDLRGRRVAESMRHSAGISSCVIITRCKKGLSSGRSAQVKLPGGCTVSR